ncbi:hypothetical protein ACFL3I_11060 [Pseudomonadota bacterium]
MACRALGRVDESNIALEELIKELNQKVAYNIAYVMAYRGEAG